MGKKLLFPIGCLLVGFMLGAFGIPGMYQYGDAKGVAYRLNRFTGVQQFASEKGWVTEAELRRDAMSQLGDFFKSGKETVDNMINPSTSR